MLTLWYYRDRDGEVQGPWRNGTMRRWWLEGLLPDNLPVRQAHSDDAFLPIGALQPDFARAREHSKKAQERLERTFKGELDDAEVDEELREDDEKLQRQRMATASEHAKWLREWRPTTWKYLDEQGQLQGPFGSNMMRLWRQAGHLADGLLVAPVLPVLESESLQQSLGLAVSEQETPAHVFQELRDACEDDMRTLRPQSKARLALDRAAELVYP
ncbi:MAG: hypothetical protein MHM6MM_007734, partial [Cercozoa sp. M6MM]